MSESILPGTLVDAGWLADHLSAPGLQVIDIRGYVKTEDLGGGEQSAEYVAAPEEFASEHVPGSVFVDWTADITDPDHPVKAQLAPAARFAEAMGARGVGDDTDVVVVDHSGGHFATRLWWALKYFGHERVAVLDGGFNGWKGNGFPLKAGASGAEPRTFTPRERPDLVVDANQVRARIGDAERMIVDARDPDQYRGAVRRGVRGGHVPSAVNVWAKTLFNQDGTWKSDDELAAILAGGGVRVETPVIAYCNGGVTATAVLFALDRIGHSAWANYDGSWNEWGERLDFPVVTGEATG